MTLERIAVKLGVSFSTIQADLKLAREEHVPPDKEELAAFVRTELQAALRGLRRAVDDGDPQSIQAQTRSLDTLCKLHGLYAPEKKELTGADGGPINVALAEAHERLMGELDSVAAKQRTHGSADASGAGPDGSSGTASHVGVLGSTEPKAPAR